MTRLGVKKRLLVNSCSDSSFKKPCVCKGVELMHDQIVETKKRGVQGICPTFLEFKAVMSTEKGAADFSG